MGQHTGLHVLGEWAVNGTCKSGRGCERAGGPVGQCRHPRCLGWEAWYRAQHRVGREERIRERVCLCARPCSQCNSVLCLPACLLHACPCWLLAPTHFPDGRADSFLLGATALVLASGLCVPASPPPRATCHQPVARSCSGTYRSCSLNGRGGCRQSAFPSAGKGTRRRGTRRRGRGRGRWRTLRSSTTLDRG